MKSLLQSLLAPSLVLAGLFAFPTFADTSGTGEVCPDIASYGPYYQTNGAYTCVCHLVGFELDTTPCQDSIDTTPAHSHCSGFSTIVDCHPFGVVQVSNQAYKCICEITGPSVTIGGVVIGLGIVNAKCVKDGAATNNGTHPTAIALECGD